MPAGILIIIIPLLDHFFLKVFFFPIIREVNGLIEKGKGEIKRHKKF